MNIKLTTILVATITIIHGCGPAELSSDKYRKLWYVMKNQPIDLYFAHGVVTEGPERSFDPNNHLSVPFEKEFHYGQYRVLTAPGQALLLDKSDRAIWAGSWVIPARVNGKIGSFILLDGCKSEYANWHEGAMYFMSRLDFSSDVHTYENIGDCYFHPESLTGGSLTADRRSCVVDIDNDGYDEVVALIPNRLSPYSGVQKSTWTLAIFGQTKYWKDEWKDDSWDEDEDEGLWSETLEFYRATFMSQRFGLEVPCGPFCVAIDLRTTPKRGLVVEVLSPTSRQYEKFGFIEWSDEDREWKCTVVPTKNSIRDKK